MFGEGDSNWAGGLRVDGLCEGDFRFPLLLTTLREKQVRDLTFKYRTEPMEDCRCDDEGSIDSCLVGTWKMDEPSMASLFGTDDPVAGRIEMTFFRGGAFVRSYSGVSYRSQSTYRSGSRRCWWRRATWAPCGRAHLPQVAVWTERRRCGRSILEDGVTRRTFIMHDGQRVTTNKTEAGLEAGSGPMRRPSTGAPVTNCSSVSVGMNA